MANIRQQLQNLVGQAVTIDGVLSGILVFDGRRYSVMDFDLGEQAIFTEIEVAAVNGTAITLS